jgi:hypothetical protein
MKSPIFVRSLSERERENLEASVRSKDTFTMRRSQMLLASSKGEKAPKIAENLGCGVQTVRDAIHDLATRGAPTLSLPSPRVPEGPATPSTRRVPKPCARCCTALRGSSVATVVCGRSRWPQRPPSRRGSPGGGSLGRPSGRPFRACSE